MSSFSRFGVPLLIVVIAAAHAGFFTIYQRPDWTSQWTDQNGYMRLGHVLAETGRFTRTPDYPQFVPEAGRTPGYPLFLALVERTLGPGHSAIAATQAALFVAICLLGRRLTALMGSAAEADAAGLMTAAYPPLPYFGALAMSEVLTVAAVTLGMLFWIHALRSTDGTRSFVACGAAFALAALTRPTFQYLALFLIAAAWLVGPPPNLRHRLKGSAVMLAAFFVCVTPWLIYNAVYFKTLTFRGAGIGRVMFEGVWQVEWPGRVEATLTTIADGTSDRDDLDRRVGAYAASVHLPSEPMLEYVHQWQDVRKIWVEPTDAMARPFARIAANREYLRLALQKIRRDPIRHVFRRAMRAPLLLWMTDIPVRYSDVNRLAPWVIHAMWLLQGLLLLLAAWGLGTVWRRGLRVEAAAVAALLLYITAVHVPLYTEGRYSLPAKPVVIVLVAIALGELCARPASPAMARRGESVTA